VVGPDGRIGRTSGRTPSTHILKTPIERLDATIANEAFCLRLGRALDVSTVDATPHRVADSEYLLVRRYDREIDSTGILRLHQEDFCQALGVPPERKYRRQGLSRKMAMKLGDEYRSDYVRERRFERFFAEVGLGPAPSRARLRRMAKDAPPAARAVRRELADGGWDDEVLGRIVSLVTERAAWLADAMATRRRGAARRET
jgi:hypothetical protein